MKPETNANWNLTQAKFLDRSKILINALKSFSVLELENLMKLSPNLAELNVERYQTWASKHNSKQTMAAALAFDGEVYRGLNAENLNANELDYLSRNLWILSGLYGILNPTDAIAPYRLEMGTKLTIGEHKNLYSFWKKTLTTYVNDNMSADDYILNLASNEYFKVLDKQSLNPTIITVDFKDYKNGQLKQIMVYFKQARGAMAKYCAQNNVQNIEQAKLFNEMGYLFNDQLSNNNHWTFTR